LVIIFESLVIFISFTNGVRRELVIGHRGDSDFAPENTMGSFQLAVDKNTDGIETDLRLTYDGHIVLIHDAVTK
jgi:glycerophosphoryl diester phosphodiesterase